MPVDSYDISAGLFVRGLTNLKAQLIKAENHAEANGISVAELLSASLATESRALTAAPSSPFDLHAYTLAAHVHFENAARPSQLSRPLRC